MSYCAGFQRELCKCVHYSSLEMVADKDIVRSISCCTSSACIYKNPELYILGTVFESWRPTGSSGSFSVPGSPGCDITYESMSGFPQSGRTCDAGVVLTLPLTSSMSSNPHSLSAPFFRKLPSPTLLACQVPSAPLPPGRGVNSQTVQQPTLTGSDLSPTNPLESPMMAAA